MAKVEHWCRVSVDGTPLLGRVENDEFLEYSGDLFGSPSPTGRRIPLADVGWLPPAEPRQFLGLWNNFHERMALEGTLRPDFPLFFVKLEASLSAHRRPITLPSGFTGEVKFEAELGIVIGRACFQVDEAGADEAIFGYTCVNDVTAPVTLKANPEFPQWCRAKSLPGFGPVGPFIARGIDPSDLRVRGILDGEVLQDYPVTDMIFSPREIVPLISRELPLYPGDIIACGTSVGAAAMVPGQTIDVEIPGVGRLSNRLSD